MKLLLDQGLPRSTVLHLHNAGIEAAHVGDRGLATASDSKILDFARQEGRVVVTLDRCRFPRAAGTVRSYGTIRNSYLIEGLRAEDLASLLVNVFEVCKDDLVKGAMVSVTENGVRIRQLRLLR